VARRVARGLEQLPSPVEPEKKGQILSTAAGLFLAKGYKGVSMKMLADAVGVTPAALYYHFPEGKEDLFATMIRTVFLDDGVAKIDEALANAGGVRERLTQLTKTLIALPLDERLSVLLRDAREHLEKPEHQRVILSLLERIRRRVTDLFQEALDTGEIRQDLPINILVGLYLGLLREGKAPRTADRAVWSVSVLFDGIAKRSGSR
jgi:AcrR family transcriptional regulator